MISDPFTLLKKTFQIYREKFFTIISLGSIVLAVGIFQLLSIEIRSSLLFMISVLSGIIVSYIVYVAMIKAISNPERVYLGKLFEEAQGCVVPALLVSSLLVLVVSGGFLLFIVPGIMAVIFFLFSLMSVIVDNKQKHEALLNSWSLVRGRWWKIFWRFFVANVIIGFVSILIMSVFWFFGIGENPLDTFFAWQQNARAVSFGQSVSSQFVSNFFAVPMSVAFTFVLYEELKRLPTLEASEQERELALSRIRFLAGAGVASIIAGIFIFGLIFSKFAPNVVNFTHAPAAVFEAL